jgi:outer membrane lipoprotein SlyB
MKIPALALLTAVVVAALPGCANNGMPWQSSSTATSSSYTSSYPAYGVVTAVRAVQQNNAASNSAGGALLGGLAGGLIGHQIGGGTGNTAATIGGAVGGAMLGSQLAQQQGNAVSTVYQVDVRLDDGSYQTISTADGSFAVGQRVMLQNGAITHY